MENNFTVDIDPKAMRHYRVVKGLKQKHLAPILGVVRTTVVNYEKQSKLTLSVEMAEELAEFLDVTVDHLTGKVKEVKQKPGNGRSFRDEIFEGDYIGMHNRVWSELEKNMSNYRELLSNLSETIKNLTKANSGQQ